MEWTGSPLDNDSIYLHSDNQPIGLETSAVCGVPVLHVFVVPPDRDQQVLLQTPLTWSFDPGQLLKIFSLYCEGCLFNIKKRFFVHLSNLIYELSVMSTYLYRLCNDDILNKFFSNFWLKHILSYASCTDFVRTRNCALLCHLEYFKRQIYFVISACSTPEPDGEY